jgi:hypothetical protein
MGVEGRLDGKEPLQIRGWAFDRDNPESHLEVELVCGTRSVGRSLANLYREDLERAGFGKGDHGFIFNCETAISASDLDQIEAYAVVPGGSPVHLPRYVPSGSQQSPAQQLSDIRYPRSSPRIPHRPVLVIGSARSGTSAIVQALTLATRYKSTEEGHFLELLPALLSQVQQYYTSKADELGRNTTIARVPQQFIQEGLEAIVREAMYQVFPSGYWIDKTPNSNMILLAPWLRSLWPEARFIFMKRRAIENIQSRITKFNFDFSHNCQEWVDAMEAWGTVRSQLVGVAIEMDQRFLYEYAPEAASDVGELLKLDEREIVRLGQMLRNVQPQRQSRSVAHVTSLAEVGWTASERETFLQICGPTMLKYKYNLSGSYVDGDLRNLGCVAI